MLDILFLLKNNIYNAWLLADYGRKQNMDKILQWKQANHAYWEAPPWTWNQWRAITVHKAAFSNRMSSLDIMARVVEREFLRGVKQPRIWRASFDLNSLLKKNFLSVLT